VCQVELRMSDCLGIVRAEGGVGGMVGGFIGGKGGRCWVRGGGRLWRGRRGGSEGSGRLGLRGRGVIRWEREVEKMEML